MRRALLCAERWAEMGEREGESVGAATWMPSLMRLPPSDTAASTITGCPSTTVTCPLTPLSLVYPPPPFSLSLTHTNTFPFLLLPSLSLTTSARTTSDRLFSSSRFRQGKGWEAEGAGGGHHGCCWRSCQELCGGWGGRGRGGEGTSGVLVAIMSGRISFMTPKCRLYSPAGLSTAPEGASNSNCEI
eukprot:961134-Rhodomonas_salina.1